MYIANNWLRCLALLYGLTFCFLVVAASVTAYVLFHPKLGLKETDPITRACISKYGLLGGLVLVNLYNSAMIILPWPFFILYLTLSRKGGWHSMLADALVYTAMSAYGLYLLIDWLSNAANDVSWLLFHSCHSVISTLWGFWESMTIHVMLAIFVVLFLFLYVRPTFREGMHRTFNISFLHFNIVSCKEIGKSPNFEVACIAASIFPLSDACTLTGGNYFSNMLRL